MSECFRFKNVLLYVAVCKRTCIRRVLWKWTMLVFTAGMLGWVYRGDGYSHGYVVWKRLGMLLWSRTKLSREKSNEIKCLKHSLELSKAFFRIFKLSGQFRTFFRTFEFSNVLFEFSNICLNFETSFDLSFSKPLLFHRPCVFNLHSTQTKPMCLRKQGWQGVLRKGIWIVVGLVEGYLC